MSPPPHKKTPTQADTPENRQGPTQAHWQAVYDARPEDQLTWFEHAPTQALDLICDCVSPEAAVIDIGAGASRLLDGLLNRGFTDISALDLSASALAISMARLGNAAERVDWFIGDICIWSPRRSYDFWHDRAVFHFLTTPAQRKAYVLAMLDGVAQGGYVAISSFAENGPEKCSGLPVQRYSPDSLTAELERHAPGQFTLQRASQHDHLTPKGNVQTFQTCLFKRQTG